MTCAIWEPDPTTGGDRRRTPGGDRQAVMELFAAYGDCFDRGDFDAFGSLFEHGTWFLTEHRGPGSAPVRAWCVEVVRLRDGVPGTRHLSSNLWLDLDVVAGTGAASSHVTVWRDLPDEPPRVLFLGRFEDRLHRIDGRWSFHRRSVVPEVVGDLNDHLRIRCST